MWDSQQGKLSLIEPFYLQGEAEFQLQSFHHFFANKTQKFIRLLLHCNVRIGSAKDEQGW